jgi:DNA-binding CsgD family transcriptional regulator
MLSAFESSVSCRPSIPGDSEAGHDLPCGYLALIIVDAQAEIRFSFWNLLEVSSIKEVLCGPGPRLRAELSALVREVIADTKHGEFDTRVVLRDADRTLRLSPLEGVEGGLYALVMEADRHSGLLARASSRFHLTRRQTEVLALVLEGASAHDVAHALVISEYTAQGYVKSLLAKTNSRNRAAMVAKVLHWSKPLDAQVLAPPQKVAANQRAS